MQNKVAMIKNRVDKAASFSHESIHLEHLNVMRKILFLNHEPQYLIEKHVRIRIEKIKNIQSNNTYMDKQNEAFDELNAIALLYFGQIPKTIQFKLKKILIHTIFRISFKMEIIITSGKDVNFLVKSSQF